jgi:DNA-nicking Smr family endonuclease
MASRRQKRALSEEERTLWDQVRHSLRPLVAPKDPAPAPPTAMPQPIPRAAEPTPLERLTIFTPQRTTAPLNRYDPAPDPSAAPNVSEIDRRMAAKLRTGRERPQGRLDLHGMFVSEAHDALGGFIRRSHAEGKRMVLVITGKGSRATDELALAPHRRGVLRHALPQWLAAPHLAPLILRITPAQARDGGSGAWYIWLRKSGK